MSKASLVLQADAGTFCVTTGQAVCERVLASKLCSTSKVWGAYMTCEKLREVDCMPIVDHCLQGKHLSWILEPTPESHAA